jgi:hypothetical protein
MAKPDDPIYQGGPVVGGKRFYGVSKKSKSRDAPTSTISKRDAPKDTKPKK